MIFFLPVTLHNPAKVNQFSWLQVLLQSLVSKHKLDLAEHDSVSLHNRNSVHGLDGPKSIPISAHALISEHDSFIGHSPLEIVKSSLSVQKRKKRDKANLSEPLILIITMAKKNDLLVYQCFPSKQ